MNYNQWKEYTASNTAFNQAIFNAYELATNEDKAAIALALPDLFPTKYSVQDIRDEKVPFDKDEILERYNDINLNYEWWEDIYNDLAEVIKEIDGTQINQDKIFFSIGNNYYLSFEYILTKDDLPNFFKYGFSEDVTTGELKELYKKWHDIYKEVPQRVKDLDFSCWAQIKHAGRQESIETYIESGLVEGRHSNLIEYTETLSELCETIISDIKDYFYQRIVKQYEYNASEDAIFETLEADGVFFDSEGNAL